MLMECDIVIVIVEVQFFFLAINMIKSVRVAVDLCRPMPCATPPWSSSKSRWQGFLSNVIILSPTNRFVWLGSQHEHLGFMNLLETQVQCEDGLSKNYTWRSFPWRYIIQCCQNSFKVLKDKRSAWEPNVHFEIWFWSDHWESLYCSRQNSIIQTILWQGSPTKKWQLI